MKLTSFIATDRGFTFLEVLTVMFLGAALFLFAMPMLQNQNLKSEANLLDEQFATHLNHARELAVTGGKTVAVCASANGVSCSSDNWSQGWLTYFDTENYKTGDEIVHKDIIGFNEIDMAEIDLNVNDENAYKIFRIRFDAHGFNAEQKKLYATLCTDFNAEALSGLVTVERTGRVKSINLSANSGTDKVLAERARNDFNFPAKCHEAIASL